VKSTARPSRIVAFFVVAIAISLGVAAGYQPTASFQGEEAAVRDVLLTSASSFEKNDTAEAMKVWMNDESLTVFESGHANYGWADYRDHHLFPEMGEMKNTKYALSDVKIHLAGKTAWATFKYTISADVMSNVQQRHFDGAGLGTAVLENRDGQWRIVHWHSSAPRRAPAPSATPKNP
jgi:ketosteroid isomerase-like protein